ncbi:MAG: hypothetical protein K0S67_904, partial [Nitrososphaeraceae archaeon]|nr:hypothetical protein [Nitrososphaeraceae archaeon]MCD6037016.1 hypothetical protein [Nitrososphaeraceae archaeon]MDF2769892.1 hypothetical protein [Nitrososphaeraceae archaeon]
NDIIEKDENTRSSNVNRLIDKLRTHTILYILFGIYR